MQDWETAGTITVSCVEWPKCKGRNDSSMMEGVLHRQKDGVMSMLHGGVVHLLRTRGTTEIEEVYINGRSSVQRGGRNWNSQRHKWKWDSGGAIAKCVDVLLVGA